MRFLEDLLDSLRPSGLPVGRLRYLRVGFTLVLLKYAAESLAIWVSAGRLYYPADFVSPSLNDRGQMISGGPEWLGIAWVIWTAPFLWAAVVMSTRRAEDAGVSQWHGLWILAPYLNLLAMIVLSVLPTSDANRVECSERAERKPQNRGDAGGYLAAALSSLLVGVVYAVLVTAFAVYLLGDYGVWVFFGAPLVSGVTSGYLLNRKVPSTISGTLLHATLAVFVLTGMLLAIGWEGAICLAMALPILLFATCAGAVLGREIARSRLNQTNSNERALVGALLVVPVLGTLDAQLSEPSISVVETSVMIEATPDEVWQVVLAFPPIDAPEPWYFRLGIASPKSAWIDGEGVGAVRHCVFTTGEFVEPITAWQAPHRLAFDVSDQPEPMFELTPYGEIHPPHLEGALRSVRGEFRIENIAAGKTRLIGRTWYQLDMGPRLYWSVWTDWILHRVHERVLNHIRCVTEARTGLSS